ncbi:MAG: DUF1775 domain-containing protein [Gaiellales bacterium]
MTTYPQDIKEHPMNPTRRPLRAALAAALAGTALLALAGTALAHAEPETATPPKAGAKGTLTMVIGHGCEDAAGTLYDTDRVVVELPKGFTVLSVPAHAGWFATTAAAGGGTRVQWTTKGAKLGKQTKGRFAVKVTYPTKKGTYGLPTIQYCGKRSTAWIQKPVGGVEPDLPLPMLTVT